MLFKYYISISILILFNVSFLQDIEYLIYTNSNLIDAAYRLADLHELEVDSEHRLNTKIINEDTLSMPINEWINNELSYNTSLEYLVILGDESIIPPIYYGINNSIPSDDYFSSNNISNFVVPSPSLKTGRILVNNIEDAHSTIDRIRGYTLDGHNGIWKNKLLLLCDNEFKSGRSVRNEKYHTIYSNNIYNNLKNLLPIINLYGTDYDMQESSDWYTQPELTTNIINTINNGVGIINYIGHGTHETLADEDILKMDRDMDLIDVNGKLPIWVIGTCSFGNYDNNICMAEELLNRDNAAIAIITTTRGILSVENYNYLNNFFNIQLKNYINNNENTRLGDIFYLAKNSTSQSYRFHLFGDPALPLIISKNVNDLIETDLDTISIGTSNNLIVNSNDAILNIYDEEEYRVKYYEYEPYEDDSCNLNLSCFDTLSYNLYGTKLYEGEFSNQINYYIPLDVNLDNKVKALVYNNDINNEIEIIDNIDLFLEIDDMLLGDNSGPEISIYYNNSKLENVYGIYPPYEIEIHLTDNLPINLSGLNFHNIRLWIDNNINSLILNNYYNPISDTSGIINLTLNDSLFNNSTHTLYIEAWDILNNHSIKNYNINIIESQNEVYNIYNIPNPVSDRTYFTFNLKEAQPIYIRIDILSKNGTILKSYSEFIDLEQNYYAYPNNGWDGRDKNNHKLQNGTYFYKLEIRDINNNIIYNNIKNITILR